MHIEHTPPKRRVQFSFSTPPKEHSNQSTLAVRSNLKSSRKTPTKSIKAFSPSSKTPYKSLKKSEYDSDSDHDETGRLDNDFYFQKMLGKGNFSRVSLYRSKMSSQPFAIKEMTLAKMSANELQALATISVLGDKNENLLKYFNSWRQGGSCYITMQYCDRSLDDEFQSFREREEKIPQQSIIFWFKQALSGLNYLHNNNIVHLDLKPENILFHNGIIKISDLGLCRLGRVNKWMELVEGDARYLDRIILNYHEGIDLEKADVFSLGMTFYEAVTLDHLPSNGPEWHRLREGNLFQQREDIKEYSKQFLQVYHHIIQIIEKMLLPNPDDRPSVKQILAELNSELEMMENRSIKKSRVTESMMWEGECRDLFMEEEYLPMEVEESGMGRMMVEEMDGSKFYGMAMGMGEETGEMSYYDEGVKLGEPFILIRRISKTPMMNNKKCKDSRERDNSL